MCNHNGMLPIGLRRRSNRSSGTDPQQSSVANIEIARLTSRSAGYRPGHVRCRHFRRGEQRGGTAEFDPAFARRGGGRRPITRSVTSARPLIRGVMMLTQPSESIGRCFDEHGAAVYAYVRGMIGPIRAEAITRDVFVELLCGDTPAANGHSVRTALLALSDRFVTTALHGRQDDPSTSSDGLDSAFASLTQDDRRAVLFVAHGDSHSETSAEALQLSVQVMATRVKSGLRHLGLQLSAHG